MKPQAPGPERLHKTTHMVMQRPELPTDLLAAGRRWRRPGLVWGAPVLPLGVQPASGGRHASLDVAPAPSACIPKFSYQ